MHFRLGGSFIRPRIIFSFRSSSFLLPIASSKIESYLETQKQETPTAKKKKESTNPANFRRRRRWSDGFSTHTVQSRDWDSMGFRGSEIEALGLEFGFVWRGFLNFGYELGTDWKISSIGQPKHPVPFVFFKFYISFLFIYL